jgi:hypothetical protein
LAAAAEYGPYVLAAAVVDNLTGNVISNGIGHAVEQVGNVVENVVSGVGNAIASIGHIFGFAEGGDHQGGLRLVGENGPELEVTGPSRIFDAQTTASMLRSGGASESEVARELAIMNGLLARILQEGRRTADATNGNPESPMLVEIDA